MVEPTNQHVLTSSGHNSSGSCCSSSSSRQYYSVNEKISNLILPHRFDGLLISSQNQPTCSANTHDCHEGFSPIRFLERQICPAVFRASLFVSIRYQVTGIHHYTNAPFELACAHLIGLDTPHHQKVCFRGALNKFELGI